ncbi:hypothetical protein GWI33_002110 [Rhynchophorus ferrugineus]|uniref:Uncharacterized protein n=1 Tax=Rhynchophorus ferrugineus TaxID=354439 RepID=A0A834MFY6_RHYFE|nr:hypothetical protein GWI33_002110 [Rhynchophorus ferrugineus]
MPSGSYYYSIQTSAVPNHFCVNFNENDRQFFGFRLAVVIRLNCFLCVVPLGFMISQVTRIRGLAISVSNGCICENQLNLCSKSRPFLTMECQLSQLKADSLGVDLQPP